MRPDRALRILHRNSRYRGIHQILHERKSLYTWLYYCIPAVPVRRGEVSAWRKRDEQIPTIVQHVSDVAKDMWPGNVAGNDVAGRRIVPATQKSVSNTAGIFTTD